jgi:hypothetical protein
LEVPDQPINRFLRVGGADAEGRVDDAVFVGVGEGGEGMERMEMRPIPSVVRLSLLHECTVFRAQAGDAPVGHGFELALRLGRNRELGGVVGGVSVQKRDLPHDVIEGGSEVVHAVSEDHAEAQRRLVADLKPLDPFPRICIEFTDRMVGLRFPVEEGVHLVEEFVELLLGSIELGDRSSKPVIR